MKRYRLQSDEEFLDALLGEDVWVKVLVDLSNGSMEPNIVRLRLVNKSINRNGQVVYDANYVKEYDVIADICECTADEYNSIISITNRIPCSCITIYRPIEILTTEEFLKIVDDEQVWEE